MRSRGRPSPSRCPRTRRRAGKVTPRSGRDPLPPPWGQSRVRGHPRAAPPCPGVWGGVPHLLPMDRRLLPFSLRLLLEDARRRVTLGGREQNWQGVGCPDGHDPPFRGRRAPSITFRGSTSLLPCIPPSFCLSRHLSTYSSILPLHLPIPSSIPPCIPPSPLHPSLHPSISPLPRIPPPSPPTPALGLTPNPRTSSVFSYRVPRWGWPARGGSCPGCRLQEEEDGDVTHCPSHGCWGLPGSLRAPQPGGGGSGGGGGCSPSLCRWGQASRRAKPGELSELWQDLGEGVPASPSWDEALVRGR